MSWTEQEMTPTEQEVAAIRAKRFQGLLGVTPPHGWGGAARVEGIDLEAAARQYGELGTACEDAALVAATTKRALMLAEVAAEVARERRDYGEQVLQESARVSWKALQEVTSEEDQAPLDAPGEAPLRPDRKPLEPRVPGREGFGAAFTHADGQRCAFDVGRFQWVTPVHTDGLPVVWTSADQIVEGEYLGCTRSHAQGTSL